MLKHRVIPTLLIQDDALVKTIKFSAPKYIGDPYDDKEKLEREERKKNKASVVWRSVSYPKSVPTRSIVFSKK